MEDYGPMLAGTCTALLRDAHLAQDVVQETFIRAYQHRGRFRGGSEKAWLTRIAVNLCRDQQRPKWFRRVDRRVPVEELALPAPQSGGTAGQLYAAVQSLPDAYREIILLRYYQDMSMGDIAQALRLTPSSGYRRLQKARQLLKRKLERGDFRG